MGEEWPRTSGSPVELELPEVLLPDEVLLDVEAAGEVDVAHRALHVHLPGEEGRLVPVLPPLLVILQVPRRHAQHAAEPARHGGLLLRRRVRWLPRRRPSLEWWRHDGVVRRWQRYHGGLPSVRRWRRRRRREGRARGAVGVWCRLRDVLRRRRSLTRRLQRRHANAGESRGRSERLPLCPCGMRWWRWKWRGRWKFQWLLMYLKQGWKLNSSGITNSQSSKFNHANCAFMHSNL